MEDIEAAEAVTLEAVAGISVAVSMAAGGITVIAAGIMLQPFTGAAERSGRITDRAGSAECRDIGKRLRGRSLLRPLSHNSFSIKVSLSEDYGLTVNLKRNESYSTTLSLMCV